MTKLTKTTLTRKLKLKKKQTLYGQAIDYISKHYFVEPNDLHKNGIFRQYIKNLKENGYLKQYNKAMYVSNFFDEEPGFASFFYACKTIPNGIICLLSALEYHNITTQAPHQIWIATNHNFVEPRNFPYPLIITRMSEPLLKIGVIEEKTYGNTLRVFSAAKTIVDCFKFRNKIGINIAIEALRDGWIKKKFSIDELDNYAKIQRLHNVMKPYIETIINE